jgi:hypothetical protein
VNKKMFVFVHLDPPPLAYNANMSSSVLAPQHQTFVKVSAAEISLVSGSKAHLPVLLRDHASKIGRRLPAMLQATYHFSVLPFVLTDARGAT